MKARTIWALLVTTLLLAFEVVVAQSRESECQAAYLFNAWARSSPDGAPNSAVYGLLVNLNGEEDTLVSASADVAEAVELHEVIMGSGDVMQMRPVEGGFVVPAQSFLELKPGGLHIMLINLKKSLVAGETFDLQLKFELAGEVSLTVPIGEVTEMAEGEMMDSDMSRPMMPSVEWDESCAKVHVLQPWARSSIPGTTNSAAYALLINLTDADVTLIGTATEAAEVVELHQMAMGAHDVMQMQPVEGGITVPAGGVVQLMPGGLHVMLINLNAELKAGDTIEITLKFEDNSEQTLSVPVRDLEGEGMSMGSG